MPCKQREPGAVPGCSTILFWSTALGGEERLLTATRPVRIRGPEPSCSYRLTAGCRPLKAVARGQHPVAAPLRSRSSTGQSARLRIWEIGVRILTGSPSG